jgi:hypothetical protein
MEPDSTPPLRMREEEARYEAIQLTNSRPDLGNMLLSLKAEGRTWVEALAALRSATRCES